MNSTEFDFVSPLVTKRVKSSPKDTVTDWQRADQDGITQDNGHGLTAWMPASGA